MKNLIIYYREMYYCFSFVCNKVWHVQMFTPCTLFSFYTKLYCLQFLCQSLLVTFFVPVYFEDQLDVIWSPGTVSALAWVVEIVNYETDDLISAKKPAFRCFLSVSASKVYPIQSLCCVFHLKSHIKSCASWTEIADIM